MLNLFRITLLIIAMTTLFTTPSLAEKTEPPMPSSTVLYENNQYLVERQSRHILLTLKQTHQVLSTSDINGGQNLQLKYLVNFQSVEANGHDNRFEEIINQSNEEYHQQLADALNVDGSKMASMGTAANINNIVHVQKTFRSITVDAFVTAGVKGNALRAGDSARWYQGDNGNEYIKESNKDLSPTGTNVPVKDSLSTETNVPVKDSGTINIILIINRALTPGAQAKVVTIISEAKSAALAELAIPSKQSPHLATGTGTDQFMIATPIKSPLKTLDSASGHLKLGELVGESVRNAVIEAIGQQNGLQRSDTRNILHALGRFGINQDVLLQQLPQHLNKDDFELFERNKLSVLNDPKLVAAAYAYAALLDRFEYGTLSPHIQNDVLIDQAVNAAIALSGKSQHWQLFRTGLKPITDEPVSLFIQAMALGWSAKWAK